MAAAGVIKAVDVLEYSGLGLPASEPAVPPHQLGFNGFKECLDRCIVVTIPFARHGWQHFVGG